MDKKLSSYSDMKWIAELANNLSNLETQCHQLLRTGQSISKNTPHEDVMKMITDARGVLKYAYIVWLQAPQRLQSSSESHTAKICRRALTSAYNTVAEAATSLESEPSTTALSSLLGFQRQLIANEINRWGANTPQINNIRTAQYHTK